MDLQDESLTVLAQHGLRAQMEDRRVSGAPITARLTAQLQGEQQQAVEALLSQDSGILDAATGFGGVSHRSTSRQYAGGGPESGSAGSMGYAIVGDLGVR